MIMRDLIDAMARIAPPELAESWDNTGLLVGDPSGAVGGPVMLTIDLTDAVLAEAVDMGVGAIVSYHPPIFRGMKSLTPATREGRTVLACASRGIAVYCPHTALDAADGGLAEWLVRRAGDGGDVTPITPHGAHDPEQTHKLVAFVPDDPPEVLQRVRDALSDAGAGHIGAYSHCTYTLEGTGTFKGSDATNPAYGEKGRLETVSEVRLETVCSSRNLARAIRALHESHPYEEPAFDVYALADKPDASRGGGRVMDLTEPATPSAIAQRLKTALRVNAVKLASKNDEPVTRIGACPGAGGGMIDEAIAQGAALFITGEMRHHETLAALEKGCAVLLAGHTNTERPYLPTLAERLRGELENVELVISERDRAPFVNLV